jgi:stage V sporulation protein D (sporulation-specific penicillin-binding protein)
MDPLERPVYDSDIATMSIGQSIAVTPLQLITAMSAIANDGVLMKPYIVKAVYNEDGSVYEETKPREVRRVISSETDKLLIGLLEQVVATGGGQKAKVKGYRIGGKTGTAQKINTESVGYKEGSYIASFCGFAPANDPEVTLLVIIDEPSGGNYYGGQIAAPVASKIFQQMFRYLNVEPSSDPFESQASAPATVSSPKDVRATVPDVIGLDVESAGLRIGEAGLRMRVEGRGTAVSQDVAPNTVVERDSEIVVRFAPEKGGTQ